MVNPTAWLHSASVLRSVALISVLAAAAFAQTDTGAITVSVTDAASGSISGAKVTVTNEGTNIAITDVTNDRGAFLAPNLRPGKYSVSVSHPGFKATERKGITVQVGQAPRVDLQLQVGDTSERITVTADTSLLESETSDRGSVIEGRRIVELPLNGRDYNQLAQLSPGVLFQTPRLAAQGFKGAFSVNGNRVFMNAFQLDGVDNTSFAESFRGLNIQALQPSVDALQEFKIQTNGYAAEFGRSAGAVVNAVIKSGTNGVHGSAYEFHRNQHLDAADFFANATNTPKPFHLRNQFGGTLGGPIRKNKTFLFGDYEGLRDNVSSVQITSVPQTAWTQGRFNVPILNPFNSKDTGTDFLKPATADCNDGKGNCWIIPANLIDPIGRKVAGFSPAPNTGAPGQLDNNYVSDPTSRNQTNQFDVRLDHTVNSALNLFGRYSMVNTHLFSPPPRPGYSEGSQSDAFGTSQNRTQGLATGLTWVIAPSLLADLRFGYSNGAYYQEPPLAGSPCPEELIGLKGAVSDPTLCGGLPVFGFPGSSARRIGRSTSVPAFNTPQTYDTRPTLSWTHNNHAVKVGFEYEYLTVGISDNGSTLGSFNFSGRFTGQNGSYQGGIADLLLGFPTTYSQDSNTIFNRFQKIYSGYGQDDWKLTRKLTLNIGLRWDFATPPREANNQWQQLDLTTHTLIAAKEGDIYSRALVHPRFNNFAPRFGFAYRPTDKWVIRGAYGIFYNLTDRTGREGLMGYNFPFAVNSSSTITGSGNLSSANALFQLQNGIPASLTSATLINQSTVAHQYQDANQKTAYVQQYNVTIQRELMRNLLLDVAYVGNLGTHLPTFRDVNQNSVSFNPTTGAPIIGPKPLAQYGLNGNIQYMEFRGRSSYNSFQAKLDKRFSEGLSGSAAFTWGKTLANSIDQLASGGDATTYQGAKRTPQNGYDLKNEKGLADFDIQMRFVMSAVWELPYGRGRRYQSSHHVNELLFGGWQISPILIAQGGLPLTIVQSQLLNLGGNRNSRPNRIADGNLPDDQRTVSRWFDTNAFVTLQTDPALKGFVPNQAFGNSGIGILRGPKLFTLDFNLSKEFWVTERQSLQFRTEFFNAPNHTNLGIPSVTIGSGFGQITSSATPARQIQFGLKYRF